MNFIIRILFAIIAIYIVKTVTKWIIDRPAKKMEKAHIEKRNQQKCLRREQQLEMERQERRRTEVFVHGLSK